jgi:predicted alpha/beta-hydrolase family hydrolase
VEFQHLLIHPKGAHLMYVFAHGAGAGMRHPFMTDIAQRLASRGVETLRYEFPYMRSGGRRPDPPGVLEATVREAIERAAELAPNLPIIAGGKSMGGRMTSQLLAKDHTLPVRGIAFLGFPLHQPGKPGRERAKHLFDVVQPMLFVQGTRDTLADLSLMREVTNELGPRVTLHIVEGGDHSFAVLKRDGRSHDEVMDEIADAVVSFASEVVRI